MLISQTDTFSSQVHQIANICKYMKRKGVNDVKQNQNIVNLFHFLNLRMNPTGSFASKWNKSFLPRKSIGCKLFSPWKFVLWLLEFVFVDLWRTDTWSWLQEWSEELLFHFYYTIFTTRTDLHCRCCPQLLYFASCLKKSRYI